MSYGCVEVSLPFPSMKCGVSLLSKFPFLLYPKQGLFIVGNTALLAVIMKYPSFSF